MTELPEENSHAIRQNLEERELDRSLEHQRRLREWLDGVADGDQHALGLLYDTLVSQVHGLCLRITKRTALAEEVVQDVFWQVWRQAPRYDPERGSVTAWVMTIARSRALDALRAIEVNECELEPDALAAIAAPDGDTPPDLLAALQQGRRLQTVMAELDPVARQLLSLAFFRGFSHEEISACSGMPLGTVKSQIRRSLQTLQPLLSDAQETFD